MRNQECLCPLRNIHLDGYGPGRNRAGGGHNRPSAKWCVSLHGLLINGLQGAAEPELRLIIGSLPEVAEQWRLCLLPQILRDWGRTDLPEYLQQKPESVQRQQERRKHFARMEVEAKQLSESLASVMGADFWQIAMQLACPPESYPSGLTKPNIDQAQLELERAREWLPRLSAALRDARLPIAPRRGPRPNDVRYLVLLDLASIFEWATGKRPGRVTDRQTGEDTGAFYCFAAAIWPVVFGSGDDGLSYAMQKWAEGRRKHGDMSPLIKNLALRNPSWGISD